MGDRSLERVSEGYAAVDARLFGGLTKLALPLDELDSAQRTSPLMEDTMVSRAASNGSVDGITVLRRQSEWELQMATADQKQSELLMSRWQLVREQISAFARELSGMRMEVDSLRSAMEVEVASRLREVRTAMENECARSAARVERLEGELLEQKETLRREKSSRQQIDGKLGAHFDRLRQQAREDLTQLIQEYDNRSAEWKKTMSDLPMHEQAARESLRARFTASLEEMETRIRNEVARMASEHQAAVKETSQGLLRGSEARMTDELNRLHGEVASRIEGRLGKAELELGRFPGAWSAEQESLKASMVEQGHTLQSQISQVDENHRSKHAEMLKSHGCALQELEERVQTHALLSSKGLGDEFAQEIARLKSEQLAVKAELQEAHQEALEEANNRALEAHRAADERMQLLVDHLSGDMASQQMTVNEASRVAVDELTSRVKTLEDSKGTAMAALDTRISDELAKMTNCQRSTHQSLLTTHQTSLEALHQALRQEQAAREAVVNVQNERQEALERQLGAIQEGLSQEISLRLASLERTCMSAQPRAEFNTEVRRLWEAIETHTHSVAHLQQPSPEPLKVQPAAAALSALVQPTQQELFVVRTPFEPQMAEVLASQAATANLGASTHSLSAASSTDWASLPQPSTQRVPARQHPASPSTLSRPHSQSPIGRRPLQMGNRTPPTPGALGARAPSAASGAQATPGASHSVSCATPTVTHHSPSTMSIVGTTGAASSNLGAATPACSGPTIASTPPQTPLRQGPEPSPNGNRATSARITCHALPCRG